MGRDPGQAIPRGLRSASSVREPSQSQSDRLPYPIQEAVRALGHCTVFVPGGPRGLKRECWLCRRRTGVCLGFALRWAAPPLGLALGVVLSKPLSSGILVGNADQTPPGSTAFPDGRSDLHRAVTTNIAQRGLTITLIVKAPVLNTELVVRLKEVWIVFHH